MDWTHSLATELQTGEREMPDEDEINTINREEEEEEFEEMPGFEGTMAALEDLSILPKDVY